MASVTYVYPKQYDLPMRTMEEMRREVMSKIKHGQAIKSDDVSYKVYVTAFYPNHVLCHGAGVATCYTYYQLWQMLQYKTGKINIPDRLKRR